MTIRARVVVLPAGTHLLELREVDLPDPGPHDVVIKQIAFGVCHSQLARIYDPSRTASLILGHESIGEVMAAGREVTYVRPGDRVFTTWIPRETRGRTPNAASLTFADGDVATTHNTYTWGTHAVIDELFVVKAPIDADADFGSIVGCALMTGAGAVMNAVDLKPGQSVAVWGAGGVGLCSIAAASILGADRVIAIDVSDDKLGIARSFGATHVVNAKTVDPVEAIRQLTQHHDGTTGVDHSFDCTGIGDNVGISLASVRPGIRGTGIRGGTNVLVGIPREPFQLDSFSLITGEKNLTGSIGGGCIPERDFALFAQWATDGLFDAAKLVTDRYCLDDINHAVDALHHGRVGGRAVVELKEDA